MVKLLEIMVIQQASSLEESKDVQSFFTFLSWKDVVYSSLNFSIVICRQLIFYYLFIFFQSLSLDQ